MKTSQAGIDLIKKFEGCRLKAYKLAGEKYFSIGYGHSFDPSVTADTVWTAAQAEAALRIDLEKFEGHVAKYAPWGLSQPQFDALVSYAYNRGPGGLRQLMAASKTISDVPDNMVKYWGTAERYKDALVKRRKAERDMFLSGGRNPAIVAKPLEEIAQEVLDGKWGDGRERKARLAQEGYDYETVQKYLNQKLNAE